jgi:hypothetical protein
MFQNAMLAIAACLMTVSAFGGTVAIMGGASQGVEVA